MGELAHCAIFSSGRHHDNRQLTQFLTNWFYFAESYFRGWSACFPGAALSNNEVAEWRLPRQRFPSVRSGPNLQS
jgi:hypothetical protein